MNETTSRYSNLDLFRWMARSFRVYIKRPLFKRSWTSRIALILVVAAIVSCFATYAAITTSSPIGNDTDVVIWLLNLDLILLLMLVTLIAKRVVGLYTGRRRGVAGSRLHARLAFIFAVLAAAPAIVMTIFSAFFMHFGIQSWFDDRVRTAVESSHVVAEAYLEEHQKVIQADILAMANDLDRQAAYLSVNLPALEDVMQTQSILRNFPEAVIFTGDRQVLSRSGFSFSLEFEELPNNYALSEAADGDVVIMTGRNDDRLRALVKLNNFVDAFLYVGRMVDPTVLAHLERTREASQQYAKLQEQRSELQVTFTMMFIVIALMLLLAAIWAGLVFARQLVLPIGRLITATDRVSAGDLSARVPDFNNYDEFDILARAFNRMTTEIEEQRGELISTNRKLDDRRRFIETVLSGVTSGIIGVNEKGEINIANAAALKILNISEKDEFIHTNVKDMLPELEDLLTQAYERPNKVAQAEVPFQSDEQNRRILLVRIAIDQIGEQETGAVLTFDDITDLQAAQRKAAWADVARRIAHEIKNPLTPIQLSAERLKRKYMSQITEDQDVFSQCTETIIHHVEDIGRMVNEFSSFARMPEPIMRLDSISVALRDVMTLEKHAHSEIEMNVENKLPNPEDAIVMMDSRQIGQAFTNIIQNALESVVSRVASDPERKAGKLNIILGKRAETDEIYVAVNDNGLGFPKDEDIARLTEPYVTHREKGTGLGLAIVKKILEDHKGDLLLGAPDWLASTDGWDDLGGATVVLVLPVYKHEDNKDGGHQSVDVA